MQTFAVYRHRILITAVALIATAAANAQQFIPARIANREAVVSEDLRLFNRSPFDAVMVSVFYEVEGHTPAVPLPLRLEPGQTLIIHNIVETLFGLTTDTTGAIAVLGPESVVAARRTLADGVSGVWLPSVSAPSLAPNLVSTPGIRQRSVRPPTPTPAPAPEPQPLTRVNSGDVATFSGSYGVSGTATIVGKNVIRLTGLRHNGGAPGLDMRIGLSTTSRKNFTVLLSTGRQVFSNATLDLVIPENLDLNSFETFTVWCNQFNVLIAEGRFRTP